jgi:hypothetical protein
VKKKKMKKYVHLYNLRIRDVFHTEQQSAVLSPAVVPKSTKAAPSAVGNTLKSVAGVIPGIKIVPDATKASAPHGP